MGDICKCLTESNGLCYRACKAKSAGFKSHCFCGAEEPEYCEYAFPFGHSHFCTCPFAANMSILASEHLEMIEMLYSV